MAARAGGQSLLHAQQVGEWITTLVAYPSRAIGPLLDSQKHDIGAMLRESLETEARALALHRELLSQVGNAIRRFDKLSEVLLPVAVWAQGLGVVWMVIAASRKRNLVMNLQVGLTTASPEKRRIAAATLAFPFGPQQCRRNDGGASIENLRSPKIKIWLPWRGVELFFQRLGIRDKSLRLLP